MKKILLALTMILMLAIPAYASDWSITSPKELGATAFWSPKDGTFYGGVNFTALRLRHVAINWASLDLDGTLAQEINKDGDSLAGLGVKVNTNVKQTIEPGFSVMPSAGLTVMTNFNKNEFPKNTFTKLEVLIYGTFLMYKF